MEETKAWYSLDVQTVQTVQSCVQTVQTVQTVPSNLVVSTLLYRLYRPQGIVDERFEPFERFERVRGTDSKDQTCLIF